MDTNQNEIRTAFITKRPVSNGAIDIHRSETRSSGDRTRIHVNTREQMDHAFISCSWHTKRYTRRSLPGNQRTGGFAAHTAAKSQNDLLNLDCHTFLLIKGRHGLCSIIVVLYLRQTEATSLRPRNDCHNWWLWYTSQK